MRKNILTLILIFSSADIFAGYMSKAKLLDCNQDKPFKSRLVDCQKDHSDCVVVPSGFDCRTYSELDTEVDNPFSPKATKSQTETCTDNADCQTKLEGLVCIDSDETARKNLIWMQVYCTKPNGFNQMTVKRIREDAVKKAAWAVNSNNPIVRRGIRKTRREQLTTAISTINNADFAQLKAIVKKMMRDKYSNN